METASQIFKNEEPVKLLADAMEAKRRIYDKYPHSLSFAVQDQIKSLNQLIRELSNEVNKMGAAH